jgi:hypothetical protein
MAKPTRKQLADALREFATFRGDGMRGVVRMARMQADALKILEKLQAEERNEQDA